MKIPCANEFHLFPILPVDLKELAARLGLSQTTVSRAINGYSDVSETTRERVSRMAEELGYQPNPVARRLARGQADAIGIVYPIDDGDLGDPRFLEILKGMSEFLEGVDKDLLITPARERSEMRVYRRLVEGRRVDGMIVSRTRMADPRIEFLRKSGLPFVAHGRTADCDDIAWLDFDNEAGTMMAVRALLAHGHRDIAYVHAPLDLNFAFQRHAGYQRAMQDAGIAVDPNRVIAGGFSRLGGYAAALRLFALARWPTAVIVDNNLCGVGVARAMLDSQVVIGKSMSLLVYDGLSTDNLLVGQRIAAIEQPTAEQAGRTMAEMLLTLVNGGTLDTRHVLLKPVFVPGNSIGPKIGD